ncbi:MAG: diguanylate cyclase [Syntrophotaleaceae bacterium]
MTKANILVVDDELFFRRLYTKLLQQDGLNIESASSGAEAMKRIRQGDIDLVVTDLVMPDMDGMEVLRQTRALSNPPDVIMATGNATIETAIQALKNGARDYLIKPFNPEKLRHLVRTCLEQRHLLNENQLLKRQINLFQQGQNLATLLNIQELFEATLQAIFREIDTNRGLAFLVHEDATAQMLAFEEVDESLAYRLAGELIPVMQYIKELKVLVDSELPKGVVLPPHTHSLCLLPLKHEQTTVGLLVLFNRPGSSFSQPLPLDNLQFLLEQASLGLGNAFHYKDVRKLIYIDDLTGLHNFRYLDLILDQEILRAERYKLEFSVVFIDLDHFKEINDTRGHLAGSEALKETAAVLKKSVREADILFRYGGDEFTGFLAETGAEGAAIVAERIRRSIEQHIFFAESGNPTHLTATIGYATFPGDAKSKQEIIDLADQAMYYGKKLRNVVRGARELED